MIKSNVLILICVIGLIACKSSVSITKTDYNTNNKEAKDKNSSTSTQASKVISTARSYKGTSYKYGGCSRTGIDCSGLTYTAFKAINIDLPRNSHDQSLKFKSISLSELKPGDLVFFTDKKGSSKVTHVGIVTEVKGAKEIHFIHASTKAGVIEENLFASWYLPLFLKGGRVI